jgi:hypothetical protein
MREGRLNIISGMRGSTKHHEVPAQHSFATELHGDGNPILQRNILSAAASEHCRRILFLPKKFTSYTTN